MLKPGRNAPCPCGSGLKYKRCCEEKDLLAEEEDESLEPELPLPATAEEWEPRFSDHVYESILLAIWDGAGPPHGDPSIEEMEDFFRKVTGRDLDRLIFPLDPRFKFLVDSTLRRHAAARADK